MIFHDINLFSNTLVNNKRLICLDLGTKKIGVAISDISKTIANPNSVITRVNLKKDFEIINNIINQDFCGFVLGFPIQMNGEQGSACIQVEKFANLLLEYFNLPIYFQDERLSTSAALKILNESDITRKKKNSIDDKISASYILQITLDHMKYIVKEI